MARRQVYEDFQPKSELKEDQGAHLLLVHLPDFVKEQVRVIYVHSTRTIRVQGERPLGNNKFRRFNRTFPVPQNCIAEKIHGKFQDGILTITMPKQTISPPPVPPKEEGPKVTPREKEPSSMAVPKPKLTESEQAPLPEFFGKDEIRSSVPQKPISEPMKQSIPGDELKLKEKEKSDDLLAPPKSPYEPKWRKSEETPSPQKTLTESVKQSILGDDLKLKEKEKRDELLLPPKSPYEPKWRKPEEIPDVDETAEKIEKQRTAKPKTESIKKLDAAGIAEDETVKRTEKHKIPEPKTESSKKEEGFAADDAEKIAEKQRITEPETESAKKLGEIAAMEALGKKKGVVGEAGKVKEEIGFMEKAKEMKNVATAAVKTALEKKEDRQLIVNMGVAVLVIVAVGAYVTFKMRSKSKSD